VKLEILEYISGNEEAYVTFIAILNNEKLIEKSRFIKEEGRWLYIDGHFLEESTLKQ